MIEYREVVGKLMRISLLHRVMMRKRTADLSQYIGQQLPVIEYVMQHDGCTQAELAAHLHVTPASVALSTKRLQKNQLLEKAVDENNLRRNSLHVTPLGASMAAKCRCTFNEFNQEAFSGFTQEEMEQLMSYLDRISINMGGGRELAFEEIIELDNQTNKQNNEVKPK